MGSIHRLMIAALAVTLFAGSPVGPATASLVARADAAPEATIAGVDLGIFVFRVDPASLAALRIPDAGHAGGALDTAPLLPLGSTLYELRIFFPPDYLTDDVILNYYPGGALDPPRVPAHPPYLRISNRPSRAASTMPDKWFVADAQQQDALRTIIAQARATELSRTLERQHGWYPDVLFAESPHFNGGDGRDPIQQDAYRITPFVNGAERMGFEVTGDDASDLFKRYIDAQNAPVVPVDAVNTAAGDRLDVTTAHGRHVFSLYTADPAHPEDVSVVPDGARFALRPLGNPLIMLSSHPIDEAVTPRATLRGDDTSSGGADAGTVMLFTIVMVPLLGVVGWRVIGWWLDR